MKKICLATLAVFGTMAFSQAVAQDAPAVTEPTQSGPAILDGLHAAVTLGLTKGSYGGEFESGTDYPGDGSGDINGPAIGLAVGYDFLLQEKIVAGIEFEVNSGGPSGDEPCPNENFDCNLELGVSYTLRGRLGYMVNPDLMVFGTIGQTQTDATAEAEFISTNEKKKDHKTLSGTEFGLGVEYTVSEHVAIRGAITYVDYGKDDYNVYNTDFDVSTDVTTFKIGAVFSF